MSTSNNLGYFSWLVANWPSSSSILFPKGRHDYLSWLIQKDGLLIIQRWGDGERWCFNYSNCWKSFQSFLPPLPHFNRSSTFDTSLSSNYQTLIKFSGRHRQLFWITLTITYPQLAAEIEPFQSLQTHQTRDPSCYI